MRDFERTDTIDQGQASVQDRIQDLAAELKKLPFVSGVSIKGVRLTTGSLNKIPHRLGKRVGGYVIMRKSAGVDIWDEIDGGTELGLYLPLQVSGDVTVDLWVFA